LEDVWRVKVEIKHDAQGQDQYGRNKSAVFTRMVLTLFGHAHALLDFSWLMPVQTGQMSFPPTISYWLRRVGKSRKGFLFLPAKTECPQSGQ
jgi:hypothetical protein